jgi:hypothetical protein
MTPPFPLHRLVALEGRRFHGHENWEEIWQIKLTVNLVFVEIFWTHCWNFLLVILNVSRNSLTLTRNREIQWRIPANLSWFFKIQFSRCRFCGFVTFGCWFSWNGKKCISNYSDGFLNFRGFSNSSLFFLSTDVTVTEFFFPPQIVSQPSVIVEKRNQKSKVRRFVQWSLNCLGRKYRIWYFPTRCRSLKNSIPRYPSSST